MFSFPQHLKGFGFAAISSFLVGFGFVFTKIVLRDLNAETASVYFYGFGLLASFLILSARKELEKLKLFKPYWKPMIILGLFSGAGSLLWFYSIDLIGPSITAFLLRFLTVFTVLWGILFFKERFNKIESLGMIMAVIGAFVITYVSEGILIKGALAAVSAAFLFSLMQVITKTYIGGIPPLVLNHFRISVTLLILLIYAILTARLQPPTVSALIFSALAGTFVGVIGISLFFKALELEELSRVNIIRAMDPFVVAIYSFLIFRDILTFQQTIGGLFIVAGIIIIIIARYQPKLLTRWLP